MIGLDTNVLVRYLVQDDPEQGQQASQLIRDAADRGEALYLTHIVLCETVWVLRRAYAYTRDDVVQLLERMLLTRQFEIEDQDLVWKAFADYKASGAGFADCLIGASNKQVGCRTIITLDVASLELDGFSPVDE